MKYKYTNKTKPKNIRAASSGPFVYVYRICNSVVTKHKAKTRKAFTIVELLVAMSIFAIVLSITSVSFIGSLRAQRAATKLIEANENASITIERIAREIRTGTSFSASDDDKWLGFINARGDKVEYYLGEDPETGNGRIYERLTLAGTNLQQDFALTSRGVDIESLIFKHQNSSAQGPTVDKITISIVVGLPENTQGVSDVRTNIQTTISSRPLNTLPPEDADAGEGEEGGE